MSKIALYGFGRIGRQFLRVALTNNLFVPEAIADIQDIKTLAALFSVDTNYGRWNEEVTAEGDSFTIGNRNIPYVNSLKEVPDWKALGIDFVVDCSGRASTRAGGTGAHRPGSQTRAYQCAQQIIGRL